MGSLYSSCHPSKTQTPSIPQTLNETGGKHGVFNRLTPKTPYSKPLLNTAGGDTRVSTKLGTDNNTTGTSKCHPPMALIHNEDSRSVIDPINPNRPKRSTPDPGAKTECQKTTNVKPDSTLNRWRPTTNKDARLIPDRGKKTSLKSRIDH